MGRSLVVLGLTLCSLQLTGQEINVEREKYPGVKRIVVKAVGSGIHRILRSPYDGYWAEYSLDSNGQAKVEKRFKWKEHLATYEYDFSDEGHLLKQTVTYDINNPKRIQTFHHFYTESKGYVIRLGCLSDGDTLYTEENIDFDEAGLRTKYTRNKNESVNYLTYKNGIVATMKSVELTDSTESLAEYLYDSFGNLIKFDYKFSAQPKVKNPLFHANEDHRIYEYQYDKSGRWTKKYGIFGRKKRLLEKRKYEL